MVTTKKKITKEHIAHARSSQLATLLGVRQQTLYNWMESLRTDNLNPNFRALSIGAKKCEMTVDEFFDALYQWLKQEAKLRDYQKELSEFLEDVENKAHD